MVPEPMPAPAVRTDRLVVGYGGPAVLKDLTSAIPEGQMTAIVGANASGKSTLLRALARLLRPTGGAVYLDGADIAGQSTRSVAARLGLLPQSPRAPDGVRVGDLVRRGRYPHQRWFSQWSASDEDALDRALELTDLAELRDKDEEDRLEVLADDLGVANFIKLDGNIGCIVNGAGLAMATMDTIKFAGGEPANFLDIGTVNDPARVVNAIRVISEDPSVKAILVNIFGGMARVDIIAQGVIDAEKELGLDVPVVMRLVGTNLAEGEALLAEAGLDVIRAESLGEAAEKAVAAAGAA